MNNNTKHIAIVLGGSFNPPTLAHKALLEHAMSCVKADIVADVHGIYVPSSKNYVERKIRKAPPKDQLVFSESERLAMLNAVSGKNCSINTVEYGDDGRGHTYDTMKRIHAAAPTYSHMFLLGADKLRILPKWHNIRKFLSEFTFVVTSRDSNAAEALVSDNELLSEYKDSFLFIPELPGDYAQISSTAAREAILSKNWTSLEKICGKEVMQMIRFRH